MPAARKNSRVPEKLVREIEELHRRLHGVYCTATCIQLALLHGLEDADQEVGLAMEKHVMGELCEIGEQFDLLLVELGGKPQFLPIEPAPATESPPRSRNKNRRGPGVSGGGLAAG